MAEKNKLHRSMPPAEPYHAGRMIDAAAQRRIIMVRNGSNREVAHLLGSVRLGPKTGRQVVFTDGA